MYWFVRSIHPSRTNIVAWPFSFWPYTYLKDFVEWMGPSVTHIRRAEFYHLPIFVSLTYTYLKDFVQWMVSSVTYIRQGGILLFSYFVSLTYTYLKDFVKWMASSVMYIHQGGILLLSYFCFTNLHLFKGFCLVNGFVNNVHPPGWNVVTRPFGFISGWICLYKDIKRETCLLISRKNKFI